jgi:DNA-binding LytR/AlgR family response regulator
MRISCVIVDDEPENLKYLQQIVEDIENVEIVKSYTDGLSFLEGVKTIKFDMCILDNKMPDITGVECAKLLKGKKVIFVSAHDVAAHDAFDVNAIDVIKKPVSKSRLEAAIKKCRNIIINEKGFVFFKTSTLGKMRFVLSDIVYIRTDENPQYKVIVTKDGEEIKTQKTTLEDMMSKLPQDKFCIINKKEILNTHYFQSFIEKDRISIKLMREVKSKKMAIELDIGDKYLTNLKTLVGDDTE